jgi:hypothetical protein
MYDATDKIFREMKEPVIPVKYERENDFVDAVYISESVFVTVSSQNNFFIVENGLVKYYINISLSTKNSLRNITSNSDPTSKKGDGARPSATINAEGTQQEDDGS